MTRWLITVFTVSKFIRQNSLNILFLECGYIIRRNIHLQAPRFEKKLVCQIELTFDPIQFLF